jgi:sec-independent protein translocase protein TatA
LTAFPLPDGPKIRIVLQAPDSGEASIYFGIAGVAVPIFHRLGLTIELKERVMGNLGIQEMIVIFVIALIVFGPKKLPEIGKSLGKGIAEFKKASNELVKTWENDVEVEKAKEASGADTTGKPQV